MGLVLILATLNGCAGTAARRIQEASTRQGQTNASVILPDLPQACRDAIGIVLPHEGEKWRAVQLRWEVVRANENEIKMACVAFYDDLRARLEKGQ